MSGVDSDSLITGVSEPGGVDLESDTTVVARKWEPETIAYVNNMDAEQRKKCIESRTRNKEEDGDVGTEPLSEESCLSFCPSIPSSTCMCTSKIIKYKTSKIIKYKTRHYHLCPFVSDDEAEHKCQKGERSSCTQRMCSLKHTMQWVLCSPGTTRPSPKSNFAHITHWGHQSQLARPISTVDVKRSRTKRIKLLHVWVEVFQDQHRLFLRLSIPSVENFCIPGAVVPLSYKTVSVTVSVQALSVKVHVDRPALLVLAFDSSMYTQIGLGLLDIASSRTLRLQNNSLCTVSSVIVCVCVFVYSWSYTYMIDTTLHAYTWPHTAESGTSTVIYEWNEKNNRDTPGRCPTSHTRGHSNAPSILWFYSVFKQYLTTTSFPFPTNMSVYPPKDFFLAQCFESQWPSPWPRLGCVKKRKPCDGLLRVALTSL